VTRAIVQLNREKRFADLRALFPPAYEPFDYEDIGQAVGPVFPLEDGRVIAATERRVYCLGDTSIEEQPETITFGVSPRSRFFAKLEEGAISRRRRLGRKAARDDEAPQTDLGRRPARASTLSRR